jgi:hypothetical protein
VKPKTKDFGLFKFVSVFRTYIKSMETNSTDSPKFSEKYQNMLSIKLFWLVFCLFRYNRNIESLCFCIEPKQPKQTVLKQTKTNRNNCKFSEKNTKICPLSQCFGCSSVFSVQSKHRKSLLRYRTETTETNLLFRIVPKVVSVPVSVVSNLN